MFVIQIIGVVLIVTGVLYIKYSTNRQIEKMNQNENINKKDIGNNRDDPFDNNCYWYNNNIRNLHIIHFRICSYVCFVQFHPKLINMENENKGMMIIMILILALTIIFILTGNL